MNYLDVYFSRINHLGKTTAERIQNGGIRSFEKWMAESPHTVRQLSVERNIYFDGIILTNKDKEHEKIMFLNVSNDTPIQIGDIMNWQVNNQIEKWILVQEEKKVNGTYRTFWIVKCNYLIKWIDSQGHLQESWCHFVSSLDSKVKGNFRTWHDLITPQPNKFAEILMPSQNVSIATNFIVEKESWAVIEYDNSSVPGIMYLSLTENKINVIYDNIEDSIADLDKLAKYDLLIPDNNQHFKIGEEVKPIFTLTKNGTPVDLEINFNSLDKNIVKVINNKLIASAAGTAEIQIELKNMPNINWTLPVIIDDVEQDFSGYIEGPDKIRLDREAIYILKGTDEIVGNVFYSISDTSLASLKMNNNVCTVKVNNENKLGEFILTANYNDIKYTKNIRIIPLW